MAEDAPYRIKNMMPGMIMMWPYSIASIPSGWHLCDGTAGTVDLRNCFLVCAGDTYDPLDSGGQDSQTHTFTGDGHFHDNLIGTDIAPAASVDRTTDTKYVTGTTDAADNRPVFKAVSFIQKL